jgi:hypothetical protein
VDIDSFGAYYCAVLSRDSTVGCYNFTDYSSYSWRLRRTLGTWGVLLMMTGSQIKPMPDDTPGFETVSINRRSVLATLGTAVTTGLAGCGGGGGGDDGSGDGDDDTESNGNTGGDDQSSDSDTDGDDGSQSDGDDGSQSDGDDGTQSDDDGSQTGDDDGPQTGGDNCPAVPSSYTREDVPATVADEPLATIEVPDSGDVQRQSIVLRVSFTSRGSVNVQSRNNSSTTVEDELSPDQPEVTDEYDLPAGARAQRAEITRTNRVDVYIPADSDVVMVSVAASGPDECLDGSLATIQERMVNSIQLA